jgi:branched-chain amino acid transport system permease protein
MITLGLYLTVATGQWSMAHGAFASMSGYTSGILTVHLGVPYPVGMLAGAVVATLGGVLLSVLTARLGGIYLAIASVAFSMCLMVITTNTEVLGGALGFYDIPLTTTLPKLYAVLAVILFCLVRLDRSRLGYAFRSVFDDEVTAESLGIDVKRIRVLSFAAGSFIAGVAGGFQAHHLTLVVPHDMSFFRSMDFFIFLAVGGMQNLWGAAAGAFVLTVIPEALRFSASLRYVLYGIVLVVVMLLRPRGIVPRMPLGVSIIRRR